MSDTRTSLLAEVEAYILRAKISATRFGILAINDGKLVKRLRERANLTLKTVERIQEFIEKPTG